MAVIKQQLVRLWQLTRQHRYISVGIAAVVALACISAMAIAIQNTDSTPAKSPAATRNSKHASKSAKTARVDAAQADDSGQDTPTGASGQSAQTSKSTAKAASGTAGTGTAATAQTSQKQLVISPSAVTVRAGDSFSGLTIRADDNRAINMPGLSSPSAAQVTFNFPAGPAKQSWTGAIGVSRTTAPGTYSIDVFGQADRTTYYRSSMIITVLPSPIMTVSMQQTGYDASQDAMIFSIRANRLYGYSQPVESLYGQSWNSGVTLQMECDSYTTAPDSYVMYCQHDNGPRPTSGTMHVNVNVVGDSFYNDAPFTLPPQ